MIGCFARSMFLRFKYVFLDSFDCFKAGDSFIEYTKSKYITDEKFLYIKYPKRRGHKKKN